MRLPACTAWRLPRAVRTRPESSPADSSYWPCRIKIKCLLGAPEGFNRERLLPRLSSSLWSQLQSHWGQGTAGWKSWASIARSATAVKRRWTAGARSSALGRDVGRTATAPKGRAARRARRCISCVRELCNALRACSRSSSAVCGVESTAFERESTRRTDAFKRLRFWLATAQRQSSSSCAPWPAKPPIRARLLLLRSPLASLVSYKPLATKARQPSCVPEGVLRLHARGSFRPRYFSRAASTTA